MAQPLPLEIPPRNHVRNCALDWSMLPKNMLKRYWPRTKCFRSCTIVVC